jgi:hypothetical protein
LLHDKKDTVFDKKVHHIFTRASSTNKSQP